jgi:hypothetical protein
MSPRSQICHNIYVRGPIRHSNGRFEGCSPIAKLGESENLMGLEAAKTLGVVQRQF